MLLELDTLFDEAIQIWCRNIATMKLDIRPAKVISDDEDDVEEIKDDIKRIEEKIDKLR